MRGESPAGQYGVKNATIKRAPFEGAGERGFPTHQGEAALRSGFVFPERWARSAFGSSSAEKITDLLRSQHIQVH